MEIPLEMAPLSMARVREIDELNEAKGRCIHIFLRHVCLSSLFHDDNLAILKTLAMRFGVSFPEMRSYAWLQAYINESSCSDCVLEPLEDVAARFGMAVAELEDYIHEVAQERWVESRRQAALAEAAAVNK